MKNLNYFFQMTPYVTSNQQTNNGEKLGNSYIMRNKLRHTRTHTGLDLNNFSEADIRFFR